MAMQREAHYIRITWTAICNIESLLGVSITATLEVTSEKLRKVL